MSDLLCHYYCGLEALKLMPEDSLLRRCAEAYPDAFKIGTQGPDFFYYDLLSPKTRAVATAIHTSHVDDFFAAGLRYALNNEPERERALAYLAGFMSHHALDTATHPFIFNRTGRNDHRTRGSRRYSYLHKKYEVLIDTAMAHYLYGKDVIKERPEQCFDITPQTLGFLQDFYAVVLAQVYDTRAAPSAIARALRGARTAVRMSRDESGKKHTALSAAEKVVGEVGALTRILYPDAVNAWPILNLGNRAWQDPTTGRAYTESYPQLFHNAVEKSAEYWKKIEQMIAGQSFTPGDISALFKNLSYLSAQPCEQKECFRYFDKDFIQLLDNFL